MPTKPKQVTLTNSSPDILNAIRNSASTNYQNYVPIATPDADSIRTIGATIMNFPALQNEFLSALINRIGRVIVTSKLYANPLSMFKKGFLDYGETVEEIFVNLCKVENYSLENAQTDVYTLNTPDVRSAFHVLNYQKKYPQSIADKQLRQAFLSWGAITDFISRIVESMYTAVNYDEYLVTKYLLARKLIDGRVHGVEITEPADNEGYRAVVTQVKGMSNLLTFMSPDYNEAGVYNYTNKDDQFYLINSEFEAAMGVEVLATSFNMDQAEFMGHRVLVNSFGFSDGETTRLNELFDGDPTYEEIGSSDNQLLAEIPVVLVSRDFFMIYDVLLQFTENYNGSGMNWQYWLHAWKIISSSPFANAAFFTPTTQAVSSITVTPATTSVSVGNKVQFTANVTTAGFAPKTVTWSTNSANVTITADGLASINTGATGAITVTATSTFNPTVKGTATINVTA